MTAAAFPNPRCHPRRALHWQCEVKGIQWERLNAKYEVHPWSACDSEDVLALWVPLTSRAKGALAGDDSVGLCRSASPALCVQTSFSPDRRACTPNRRSKI